MKSLLAGILILFLPLFSHAESGPLLIVVGMASEAQAAAGGDALVVISAGNRQQLQTLLSDPKYANVRAVISFGSAGGLDPALKPGDVVLVTETVARDGHWNSDANLSQALAAQLQSAGIPFARGKTVTVDQPVADPSGRSVLRSETGAGISDMESSIAAEFARAHGIPFAGIRAVTDTADETLPPAALLPLKSDGTPDNAAIQQSLQNDPSQLSALMKLNTEIQSALGMLRKCRGAISI